MKLLGLVFLMCLCGCGEKPAAVAPAPVKAAPQWLKGAPVPEGFLGDDRFVVEEISDFMGGEGRTLMRYDKWSGAVWVLLPFRETLVSGIEGTVHRWVMAGSEEGIEPVKPAAPKRWR